MGFWSGLADGVCWIGAQCEAGCRWGLNGISGEGRWGDRLYDDMLHPAVEARVAALPSETIERIANPESASDFGALLGTGLKSTGDTLGTIKDKIFENLSPDILGTLMPLAIGAGIVGGVYLLADSFSGATSEKRSRGDGFLA